MDGRLIHVSGRLQYLFPSDGGQITVENISFVEGEVVKNAQNLHIFETQNALVHTKKQFLILKT